ncbi:helix-turn-helix domain-containing protein [Microvirga makkahensis]|uniref:Helix-turn-helix domain-containing protein n=1 Tax=Microvirga makkahensis TaxID=1128670 RepID=A0A7X3MS64_9HYPH|nr:AraC family transcriptional regulator [Microvirga makkahensis]MXQ12252.1 helix-turn-helix domain-containing protein [Microvirga makkahensis]
MIGENHSFCRNNIHNLVDAIPPGAGPRAATFRGSALYSLRSPGEQTFLTKEHCAAIVLSPCPGMSAAFESDRLHQFDAPTGMLVISPALTESRTAWSSRRENVVVGLTPASLLDLAAHEFDQGAVDLHPIAFGRIDPTALYLGRMLKSELARAERANELYIDSLVTQFGIHLLRNYAGRTKPSKTLGGLSAGKAKKVKEYLHENYARKLAVADLAAVCDLSVGYFITAFTKTFGLPPHQYLINLRLASAERLLMESDMRISEVAYRTGFSSQSHLSEAMRKYRRVNPSQIRRG